MRRLVISCSPDPLPDRHVTHAKRLPNGVQRETFLVRLQRQPDALLSRLAENSLRCSHRIKKGVGPRLILHDLRGTADPATWGRCAHGCAPTFTSSVGTVVARPAGTWKDPTRISLGSDIGIWVLVGTSRDLAVACHGVNDDPCESCLQAMVAPGSRRPPGPTSRQARPTILPRLRDESTNRRASLT